MEQSTTAGAGDDRAPIHHETTIDAEGGIEMTVELISLAQNCIQTSVRLFTVFSSVGRRSQRNCWMRKGMNHESGPRSGLPIFSPYVASKGGIIGLTRGRARDLGRYNIRVNCIHPGAIQTEGENRTFPIRKNCFGS